MADIAESPTRRTLVSQLNSPDLEPPRHLRDGASSATHTPTSRSGFTTPSGASTPSSGRLAFSHLSLLSHDLGRVVHDENQSADAFARKQAEAFASRSILAASLVPREPSPAQATAEAQRATLHRLGEVIEQRAQREVKYASELAKWLFETRSEEEARSARIQDLADKEEKLGEWKEAMNAHIKEQRSEISQEFSRINLSFPSEPQLVALNSTAVEAWKLKFCLDMTECSRQLVDQIGQANERLTNALKHAQPRIHPFSESTRLTPAISSSPLTASRKLVPKSEKKVSFTGEADEESPYSQLSPKSWHDSEFDDVDSPSDFASASGASPYTSGSEGYASAQDDFE